MSSNPDSKSGQQAPHGDAAPTARTRAQEAAATAESLAGTLSGVLDSISEKLAELETYGHEDREQIVDLKTYNRRHKHIVIGLAISVILDVSLSIAAILLGVGLAHQNSSQQASLIAGCQATNVTRAQDKAAWNILLEASNDISNSGNAPVVHEQQELVAQLKASVAAKDAMVNCVARYGDK